MKHFRFAIRCVEGRTVRHDPQNDDPELQTDMGECKACRGDGCDTDGSEAVGQLLTKAFGS
ncbi:hypothetical protein ONR75_15690 [Rhodopseudomonas sp. P2A-2r]|uniref:hypothetical protein n=1 Tax=Rhodopseudomonas sp. P2A-2r TaxID=2991972 RepID=UPI002234C018|nr:hypothetical protein [Rhodopseudomonas sp. P2A-2r]UZE51875.1 hypothetical protein ONR75_15690 [Rhodopseudomonas sp. P2A-2r]